MKRILLYAVIFAAVLVIPKERTDVGKLQPVQTVAIYRSNDQYVIETDTADIGTGQTLHQAFDNLIETTPAVVYLDTAEFLLLDRSAEAEIGQLGGVLNHSVELYLFEGTPNLNEVSKFLSVHGKGPKLKNWENGSKLPVLQCKKDRMILS